MAYQVIYRVSYSPRYSDTSSGWWHIVQDPLYNDEMYLYREKIIVSDWVPAEHGPEVLHCDFVKVVDEKWLKGHNKFYNCPVYDDRPTKDGDFTQYEKKMVFYSSTKKMD